MADFASFDVPVYEPLPADVPEAPSLAHNIEHVAQAIAHLIEHFRKPRNTAIVAALANETQQVEDVFWAILQAFDPDTAVGEQLDFCGRLVGERRENRVDDDYRAAVRARRLVNASEGKADDLFAVALALLPGAQVNVEDFAPFSIVVTIRGVLGSIRPTTIARMLRQAKRGGVGFALVIVDPSTSFVWTAVPGAASALGWAAVAAPNVGGAWTGVV